MIYIRATSEVGKQAELKKNTTENPNSKTAIWGKNIKMIDQPASRMYYACARDSAESPPEQHNTM